MGFGGLQRLEEAIVSGTSGRLGAIRPLTRITSPSSAICHLFALIVGGGDIVHATKLATGAS
jgi:hypothetical protein